MGSTISCEGQRGSLIVMVLSSVFAWGRSPRLKGRRRMFCFELAVDAAAAGGLVEVAGFVAAAAVASASSPALASFFSTDAL